MKQVAEVTQEQTADSQCEAIIAYLKVNPYITRLQAMSELQIGNVTARISELRQKGKRIGTLKVPYIKANGKRTQIAKWYLEAA